MEKLGFGFGQLRTVGSGLAYGSIRGLSRELLDNAWKWSGSPMRLDDKISVLRSKLRGEVHGPDDPMYDTARLGTGLTPVDDRFPAVVVLPTVPEDVAHALEFARSRQLEVSVRSGGNDVLGASTTRSGVLIDLSLMNSISLDYATGIGRVGAGTRGGALNSAGAPQGWAPVIGSHPRIGLGGVILGGGLGPLCGRYGAAVDNLLAVEIVTAEGRLVHASADDHADLFWALRGGGGNFGVATAFRLQLRPVRQVLVGAFSAKVDASKFLRFYREFISTIPDELDLSARFSVGRDPTLTLRACWMGDPVRGQEMLNSLTTFAPLEFGVVTLQDYVDFANGDRGFQLDRLLWRGGALASLTDSTIDMLTAVITGPEIEGCSVILGHYMHGALCRVSSTDTPLIRTEGQLLYTLCAFWDATAGRAEKDRKGQWVRASADALGSVSAEQTYINYLSDNSEQSVRHAFGSNYARLREIKHRHDPENLFCNNRNIVGSSKSI
jgi:FAD/FMN-containing dehydrogenase